MLTVLNDGPIFSVTARCKDASFICQHSQAGEENESLHFYILMMTIGKKRGIDCVYFQVGLRSKNQINDEISNM